MRIEPYDQRQDGTPPDPGTLARMTTPGALRARAAVRVELARQDVAVGDTWAAWRNQQVAQHMLERAARKERVRC
jgi:hypothetical protein